jgi:hypothetical protein
MGKEGTLAERLGVTSHVSPLRFKLQRLMSRYPIDDARSLEDWLLDLANARGVTVVSRSLQKLGEPVRPLPGFEEVSNAELITAICQVQALDRPQWLRAAAQLITRGSVDLPRLIFLAKVERVERILAELARQARKVEPDHPVWLAIADAFASAPPLRDSLVHWTRLAEPEMRPGRPNAAAWHLVG